MWPFAKKRDTGEDWEKYIPDEASYMKLQEECKKRRIPIYVDNPTGSPSSDIFRQVASEYELHRRLLEKNTVDIAKRAYRIALLSLFVAFLSLIASLFSFSDIIKSFYIFMG